MESMQITGESSINQQSFPLGRPISSSLPSNAVGDCLEVHEFLCRFQEVLELEEPLTFEEFEKELLCQCPENGNFDDLSNTAGESSILETVKLNCDKMAIVHRALLHLVSDAKVFDMLPFNQLTWPEVVRRYIMAYLITGGRLAFSKSDFQTNTKLSCCLLGDGGIFCGSHTGVAGVDLDSQLLGRAVDKVFGKLIREGNILSLGITNGGIPEWAKALHTVEKLPTNVGSRIRNCVYEALKKNPPEWAKKDLEASIAKGFYKGNASGPTKNAVKEVLEGVLERASTPSTQKISSPDMEVTSRRSELISKVIMKKCRSILRHVAAAYDIKKVFCDLVGRNFNSDDYNARVVSGSVSTCPLDLRTIDLRILHGTYGGSHEAFLEDVKELRYNLRTSLKYKSTLAKLADDMLNDFESLYKNEEATLFKRLFEHDTDNKFTLEVEELEEIMLSIGTPEAPWQTGICKICGVNKNDANVLLCDTEGCNAEYHTYCLNPPIYEIPEGKWFCPTCAPRKHLVDNKMFLQFVDESWEEASQFLDIVTALEEREYWELEADKKIFLL